MSRLIDSISSIPPPFNMIVWIVLIGVTGATVSEIAKQVRKYVCHRQELEFKRELVDRGLSAAEIEEVVRLRSPQVEADV